jgi:hypothetical protein
MPVARCVVNRAAGSVWVDEIHRSAARNRVDPEAACEVEKVIQDLRDARSQTKEEQALSRRVSTVGSVEDKMKLAQSGTAKFGTKVCFRRAETAHVCSFRHRVAREGYGAGDEPIQRLQAENPPCSSSMLKVAEVPEKFTVLRFRRPRSVHDRR